MFRASRHQLKRFPGIRSRVGVSRAGFTVAEIVVSIFLFTLMIVAVAQTVNNSLLALANMNSGRWDGRSMRAIREHVENLGSREAIEEGGELELAGWPQPGDRGDASATQPTKIRWTAELNPTSTLNLHAVSVEVQVEGRRDDDIAETFTIFLYRPAWTLPEDSERITEAKLEVMEKERLARGEQRKEEGK